MSQTVSTPPRDPFTVYSSKALEVTSILADGDLLLEGWAARWAVDREDEAFLPHSFDKGIKAFLGGTAALCFQHRASEPLGRVLSLERRPEGLWMRAKVDGALRFSERLRTVYEQIKSGTIRGASVGGFFGRINTPGGPRIGTVDLTEISLTPVPVGGHGTVMDVIAGKAMGAKALGVGPSWSDRLAVAEMKATVGEIHDLKRAVDRARVDRFMRS